MRNNTSINIGSLILMNKVDSNYNLFDSVLYGLIGKTKHLKESVKTFIFNRLGKCVSINRLTEIYPEETFEYLGFREKPRERTLYRDLERIGNKSKFILENYQKLLKRNGLVSKEQFIDFSSSYFEGNSSEFGELGYSRDHEPGKKQITWGIATGINNIPTALTIQKGNTNDVKHFKFMLNTAKKILEENSLLIFDYGGNSKANKEKIVSLGYNYLTRRQKKKELYKKYLELFKNSKKQKFVINGREYSCVKFVEETEVKYLCFCEKLKEDQLRKREKKFIKELEKNDKLLRKIKKGKEIAKYLSREGEIIAKGEIQQTLANIRNPYINELEGYFILESSIDEDSEKILRLYKDRDKAEKLIRDMKEGTELRPIRHWSKSAIVGYLVIIFLTNCLIKLTHFLSNNSIVKNLKLLKKYLNNLTVTIVYDKSSFKFSILSNVFPEIRAILGDYIDKYEDKSLKFRW